MSTQLARVGLFLVLLATCTFAAPPAVELELVTDSGIALDAPQKWLAMMQEMKIANVRIRSGSRGDVGQVKNIGTEESPRYAVTGIITSGNLLKLPGASIRLNDKTALSNYLAKLQDGGEEGVTAKKVMYGLTKKQMLEIHEALKDSVDFSTKGEPTGDVIRKLAKLIDLELAFDSSARKAQESDDPVLDEFQGLACGTTLAGVLRPLGFVLVPEKKLGSKLRLLVTTSKNVDQPWPIGWDTEATPSKLAPDYFVKTNITVKDYVLSTALEKIQPRINLPMLFDHNSIARHRVDLQAKVNSKEGRKSYASVVDQILHQGGLKGELRIDEGEKPFLWITTRKQ